uniref:Reverse transcriptase domain-containing protein n=1 Tax=Tanacetum cinerariifolium TaxID=118510 RepID=A0A6L2JLX8_TANCI|nr:reverse transcriptase domain-containing protein [Tanacetum cinerariifolium]
MADNRTMEELLQTPTEGCGEAIVIPEINADHFEIKTNLLQLVQANPYHGFKRENPHTHINNFKRATSTLKFRDVHNDVIKLMMFPYSLEGAAEVWCDKEPPNSILTFDDLINMFVNQFFPPSKTTYLKNEKLTQIDTFYNGLNNNGEAWEQFKELLRACPHHGFMKLTQIDTFYNGINNNDQDSLNTAAGGNILSILLCNTIPNPKGEIKAITTRSGVPYEGPLFPTNPSLKKVVERETEETTDKEQTNLQGSTAYIQPLVVPISEPDVLKTLPKPNIPYPSILNDQKLHEKATNQMEKRSFLRTSRALIDVYGEEITLWVNDEAVSFNLNQTTRYSSTYDDMLVNRIDIINIAWEEYAQEVLGFSNNSLGGNPTSTFVPIISDSSPSLTPFKESDFILEEIKCYLKDDSVSPKFNHANCDPKGDICLGEKLLRNDPFQLPRMDLKQEEVAKAKSSFKEHSELELKDLPSHFEYAYLDVVDKLPVIIAKCLKDYEKEALLKLLKSHKRAIAWKITNIKGMEPRFCTHQILMEGDYKPTIQSQRRVNLKIYEISRPMTHLLEKETLFVFSKDCIDAFETLKRKLVEAPILVVPNWNLPFELMCNASDFAIGTVLGQHKTKHFKPIHYASKTMTEAQIHYTTIEKEMLAVLLLQEFDIIIRDKKGTENLTADHLSRLENPHKDVFENKDINENFPLETLGKISSGSTPWFSDFVNYHARNFIIKGMSSQQ